VTTTVHNTVLDHRLRVLLPTNLKGDVIHSDSTFDVVERKVQLAADNAIRKELDVETKPHFTWTAFSDAARGVAIVTRGIPEVAVSDTAERPIALTLLRAFRRAVLHNDNMGGQIQGTHTFRYDIVPFDGAIPTKRLCVQGQRILGATRQIDLIPADMDLPADIVQRTSSKLPREQSFLRVDGDAVVVTSIQRQDDKLLVRVFNPTASTAHAKIARPEGFASVRSVTLEGKDDSITTAKIAGKVAEITVPSKRIATLLLA
jgi:alpha-mannosidase